ncbi:DnaJ-like protein [Hypoxylon texense]
MHNANFPHIHTPPTQTPSTANPNAKTVLKRLPSRESLASIGYKPSSRKSDTGIGTGTGTGTDKGTNISTSTGTRIRTRPTIISHATTAIAKTTTITSTSTSTASSQSSTARTPLRRRDQNATSSTTSRPTLKESGIGSGNMPYDTSSAPPSHANTNRPQMPSLSSAAARAMNRNPLTPKIASKTTQKPPTLATTTPASQRTQHTAAVSSSDPSSFVSHLSSNITPRSGSRQNRVDSANSTPNVTPIPERTESWDPRSSFGLPSPTFEGETMRGPAISFGSVAQGSNSHGRQDGHHGLDSKFFHASDAKPPRPVSASNKAAPAKGPTFFYANGNTVESKPPHPIPFTPVLGHSQEALPSKFMYANGIPEARSSPTPPVSRSSGSGVSIAPKAPTNRSGTNTPIGGYLPNHRPISPEKLPSQVPSTSSKANIPVSGRPQVLTNPQLGPSPPGLRRSSTGPVRPGGHSRQGSLARVGQVPSAPKLTSPQLSPETLPPVNVPSTPAPLTLASLIQAAEDFAENEESASPGDEARSGLQSPTKSVHSADPLSELVVNARRERKVQDLQITNASLEAINRTLERQLRKQTAELRRFRRMSRTGLSLSSTTASSRESSAAFSEQGIGIMDLSDLSEVSEAEPEPKEDEEDSSFDSDSGSGSLSPSIMAERDGKHRKRDEARLQLDLSKHQQLLIDSQKINQSIKRCLDWTEELISEGKKALEYHVRVSDVELGGRVLDPLEEEDDERPPTSDGAPDDAITLTEKMLDSSAILGGWSFEPQDRDSGIELAVDGG